jgi:hypothetical protein
MVEDHLRNGDQRMLRTSSSTVSFFALISAALVCLFVGILVFHPIYVNICEAAQAGEQAKCEQHDILYVTFLKMGEAITHAEFWTAAATIAIAVFTYTLKRSTDKLWDAGEKQFGLARKEFLSTHRPRIRFKHVWLMSAFAYDLPVMVRVVCVNNGVNDAVIIEYAVNFFVVRTGRLLPVPDFEGRKVQSGFRLQSGVSLVFPDFTGALAEADEVSIRNHEAKFYCVGYLHYRDDIGRVRTTAFCRALTLSERLGIIQGGRFIKVEDPDYEYQD